MVGADGTQRLCLEDLTLSVRKNRFCLTYRFQWINSSDYSREGYLLNNLLGTHASLLFFQVKAASSGLTAGSSAPSHRASPSVVLTSLAVTMAVYVSRVASEPQTSACLCAPARCWSLNSGDGTRAPQARPAMASPTEPSPQTTPWILPCGKCTGICWEMPAKTGVAERKLGSIGVSCELQIYCQLLLMEHLRLQVSSIQTKY